VAAWCLLDLYLHMATDGQRFLVGSRQEQAVTTVSFADARLGVGHQKLSATEFAWRRVPGRGLICNREVDGHGAGDALAGQRSLIDDRAVGPLRSGNVVDLAPQTCDIEAVLGVDFVQADEVGHDVGNVARAGGDQDIDARSGGARAGARRLEHNGVRRFFGRGDAGNFSDLKARAKQLNARGPKGVSLEQWDL